MSKKINVMLALMFFVTQLVWAQNKTLTGKVTDNNGAPIAGVSVVVKGTTNGTFTGPDGTFSFTVLDNAKTLVVSAVGYASQEIAISGTSFQLSLKVAEAQNLDEVVVVGYGTKIKKDITSSVAKVTSKEFQNLPLPSFEQALQGRASGVYINTGSGKLGQGLNIRVRGISSISANQQPFVVIDGVPVVSQSLGSATEPDNPLATLNPDDIE
ncbi:MAG: carboxypeptidase-like regulatory domain-containing protein, partial [Chitinophagaceae bacterium]|nr:carboxypeptidase-like regulatory domain-containing protein [Chitinophagaceae bacterium]